jgi:hypothetical protein
VPPCHQRRIVERLDPIRLQVAAQQRQLSRTLGGEAIHASVRSDDPSGCLEDKSICRVERLSAPNRLGDACSDGNGSHQQYHADKERALPDPACAR